MPQNHKKCPKKGSKKGKIRKNSKNAFIIKIRSLVISNYLLYSNIVNNISNFGDRISSLNLVLDRQSVEAPGFKFSKLQ